MLIWAHRGCSQMYPENTLTSFEKAMNVPGLAGIELDIQLTRDGEMVVIHDERVDRTTDGFGFVRDYSLKELKTFHIHTGNETAEHIPTMREVFELLAPKLRLWDEPAGRGIRLNIELKNSVYPYEGMEEKIVEMVQEFGVEKAIVYSSFYADSLLKVHGLDPSAELGVLDTKVSDCLYKAKGLEKIISETSISGADAGFTFALHPYGNGLDIPEERLEGRTVRAWFGGHLYPEKPTGGVMSFARYEEGGVTDLFLNEPEKYLGFQ